jgi:hypothetical protein
MTDSQYRGEVYLTDDQMTSLAVVVDACRSVGASALPFAISDEELRDASLAIMTLARALGYGS